MATDRLFNQTQGDSLLSILAQIRDGYNSVDGAFSLTSENPIQNKKITGAVTDTIETLGGTAQKAYAIGQYFLANDGYYYVATAAITAGSSNISSSTGGNCSKTCITAAMNNLSSQISNLENKLSPNAWVVLGANDTFGGETWSGNYEIKTGYKFSDFRYIGCGYCGADNPVANGPLTWIPIGKFKSTTVQNSCIVSMIGINIFYAYVDDRHFKCYQSVTDPAIRTLIVGLK